MATTTQSASKRTGGAPGPLKLQRASASRASKSRSPRRAPAARGFDGVLLGARHLAAFDCHVVCFGNLLGKLKVLRDYIRSLFRDLLQVRVLRGLRLVFEFL